jgi:hypothetical protein
MNLEVCDFPIIFQVKYIQEQLDFSMKKIQAEISGKSCGTSDLEKLW